jgi:radical SAM superfamily enzyme YgiQ (UPF0313 family)/SAM-dependent methyltransferase
MHKKILLTNPRGHLHWISIALSYLKSNIPRDYDVILLDCTAMDIAANSDDFRTLLRKHAPDVIGVSALTSTIKESLNILRECKSSLPNAITILGGTHPSVYPHKVLENQHCDFILRGEGEHSFPAFLQALDGRRPLSTVSGLGYRLNDKVVLNNIRFTDDLDSIKWPDYTNILGMGWLNEGTTTYGIKAPLWLTRGCPYACRFCSAGHINGHKIRRHSVDYATRWVQDLYRTHHVRHFSIIDDNFTYDIAFAKDFCRRIIDWRRQISESIHFENSNGVRMQFLDDELLALMRDAGWRMIPLAPESGSRKTLRRMNKQLDPDIVPIIVEKVRDAGLRVFGGFIVGYPGETEEDIHATVDLIRKCRFDSILIYQFCPLPGTPIFDELVKEGAISPDQYPSTFFLSYLSGQKAEGAGIYVTPELKNFNFRWLALREYLLLALRNPRFLYDSLKAGKVSRLLRHLFYFTQRQKSHRAIHMSCEDKAVLHQPIAVPADVRQREAWQNANRRWWEANPMRYDWRTPLPGDADLQATFEEIDRRFFEASRPSLPWEALPFESLADFKDLKDKDVLEIGVGYGSHAALLARHAQTFTGIDITEGAVRMTKERMRLGKLQANILQMDAETLSFPDASFDLVWTWGVIHHSADTPAVLKEISRVLRPGGKAVIMVYHRGWWNYYVMATLGSLLRGKLLRADSLHEAIQLQTDGALARYYSPAEWRQLIQNRFACELVAIRGQKADVIPLPAGRLKKWAEAALPDAAFRLLAHDLKMGGFLVSILRKL